MRTSWNDQKALSILKKWIDDDKWKGTVHFRKHNSSLYEYLYRTMGLDSAFSKLSLNYSDFKKSKGRNKQERQNNKVIQELNTLIKEGKWKGVRHLQLNHSLLYRELSRIGFKKSFEKLGLDYKDFRHSIWSEEDILKELKEIIDKGKWKGTLHLKKHNSKLYNAVVRGLGFSKAFSKIGLNYNLYKKH